MPELPEVETVVRELRPLLMGKIIEDVEPLWSKTFVNKSHVQLSGQSIKKVLRRGKYIIFQLNQSYLIIHLRMTGRLSVKAGAIDRKAFKHLRCIIHFSNAEQLLFEDTRKFGRIYHVDSAEQILKDVGTDALDPALSFKDFYNILKNRKMGVKAFLMSQKWISGLGNIYTDESLFRAKIHPEQKCSTIGSDKAEALFRAIRFILQQAVKNMGSTISDYRDAYGNPGKNQFYFKVYRRAGQPCFECGTPIEKKRVAGRGSHFCPQCQKIRGQE